MAKPAKDQAAKDRETERINAEAQGKHQPPEPTPAVDQQSTHPSPDPVKPRF